MKVILEKLGSPYLSRRIVRAVNGSNVYEFSVKELIKIGAGIQSLRDTTSKIEISLDGEGCVIETPKYQIVFFGKGDLDLVCLEEEEELPPVFHLLKKIIGYTAAIGFIAAVYDGVKEVEKRKPEAKEVSSEEEVA